MIDYLAANLWAMWLALSVVLASPLLWPPHDIAHTDATHIMSVWNVCLATTEHLL